MATLFDGYVVNAKQIGDDLKKMAKITEEVMVKFEDTGITFVGMDTTKTTLITYKIQADMFSRMNVYNENASVLVNIEKIGKWISSVGSKADTLYLEFGDDSVLVKVIKDNFGTVSMVQPYIVGEVEVPDYNEFTGDVQFIVEDAMKIKKFISAVKSPDEVEIITEDSDVKFVISTDTNEFELVLDTVADGEGRSSYSAGLLKDILDFFQRDIVTIEYSDGAPMKIDNQGGKLVIVAPRVAE